MSERSNSSNAVKPDISGIAPFFIVRNVPAVLAFYRDRLGFDVTFQGLAAEFSSRNVEFSEPLKDTDGGIRAQRRRRIRAVWRPMFTPVAPPRALFRDAP